MNTLFSLPCAAIWALAALAAGCGDPPPKREWTPADHGHPEVPDSARVPAEPEAEPSPERTRARAAAALWNASCASCHGRDGRGQGAGRPPGAQIVDFTQPDFQSGRSDSQLAQVIRDGRGLMPEFKKQINEQGVGALIAHIRALGEAGSGEPPQQDPSR
jgi:mono/diheme cytochrome c family protein